MADAFLGQRLIDAGWKQGVLLPPVSSSVVFLPDNALTGIAKRAKDSPPADTINVSGSPPHSVGSGIGLRHREGGDRGADRPCYACLHDR